MIEIAEELRVAWREAASEAAPLEFCGLVYGDASGETRRATHWEPVRNSSTVPSRFAMEPRSMMEAEERGGRYGKLLGVIHSHPSERPIPSAQDRDGLWPGALAFILGVPEWDLAVHAFDGQVFAPVPILERSP